ncbi:MAG: metallophosphoesterase [Oscillospiraceae bacterium]|nr:metallophosphoesterase [Oscillospiraceae bacterium]
MRPNLLPEFKTHPTVFAVGDAYQIMVPVKNDVLFWVTVGDKEYYDHSNGILRSADWLHKVTVPMAELDAARAYTVHYRKIIERIPYFSTTEDPVEQTYSFRPLEPGKPIRMFHLSDTHGNFEMPAGAQSYLGEDMDLLILNGDIPDHSGIIENFALIYELGGELTCGQVPCIFSRGNHDTRGICAEKLADYTPTDHGCSYFTVRLGSLWALLLDCGEDKPDEHPAYGHTTCFHAFREEQTRWLEKICASEEYKADGIEHRVVIAHQPFTYVQEPPFDIEQDIYGKWTGLVSEYIKPELIICGHLHTAEVSFPGGRLDHHGQPCPVVVGATPVYNKATGERNFIGSAITLAPDGGEIVFVDKDQNVTEKVTL